MKKVILDTNFLLIPFTHKVDIFTCLKDIMTDKYNIYIIDKTIKELVNIQETQKGKNSSAAKFALMLVKKKRPKLIKTGNNDTIVDDEIINLAKKDEIIVATQDKALKDKLKLLNTQIIVLRQKTHLKIL